MNVMGGYIAFMLQQVELIFSEMSKTNLSFSFNVRGDELVSETYVSHLETLCERYAIKPERVTIELLEEKIDLNNPQVIKALCSFLSLGMGLSIDDYGSVQSGESRILMLQNKGVL